MLRKILLPALAVASLAGCATGYGYRGGNGDYYYGQPRVEYRYYGGYGYGGYGGLGQGYYLDGFGRFVFGYPYGYYGGRYPGYPYGHFPRPPQHGPGHGHDHGGGEHHDHDRPPPGQGGYRPGNRPPWRDIGRVPERGDHEQSRPRRPGLPEAMPREPRPAAPLRPPALPMRAPSESRPKAGNVGGGSGQRPRMRTSRSSADE